MTKIDNLNISSISQIISPKEVKQLYPLTNEIANHVLNSRNQIENILSGKDKRIFGIVGPCSIHDPKAAIEYAKKLKILAEQVKNEIFIIMRVYFEKPRTTVGWKGLINDPYLDDSFVVEDGLKIARELMLEINKIGLPIATEALDPISPQYLSDLVSWGAIGARTTESQTHREMASGLSFPVGFKNGTDGSIDVSVNAILSSSTGHAFLGVDENGMTSIVRTKGNKFSHIILRGGKKGSNYSSEIIQDVKKELTNNGIDSNIVIDCSHANSGKDYKKQRYVLQEIISQLSFGEHAIKGFMLESNLHEGSQKLDINTKNTLKYGVSITDGCLGWETTENNILEAAKHLKTIKETK